MPYAHYVSYTSHAREFLCAWPRIVDDTGAILAGVREAGGQLTGSDGAGVPRVMPGEIAFNRRGGGWAEAFVFTIAPGPLSLRAWFGPTRPFRWCCCVTNRRWDHDLAVTAVLLRAYQVAPSHVAIGSDGGEQDWYAARTLLRRLFPASPLVETDPLTDTLFGPPIVCEHHDA